MLADDRAKKHVTLFSPVSLSVSCGQRHVTFPAYRTCIFGVNATLDAWVGIKPNRMYRLQLVQFGFWRHCYIKRMIANELNDDWSLLICSLTKRSSSSWNDRETESKLERYVAYNKLSYYHWTIAWKFNLPNVLWIELYCKRLFEPIRMYHVIAMAKYRKLIAYTTWHLLRLYRCAR